MIVTVAIDETTAMATVAHPGIDPWSATVTRYQTARGTTAYRLNQHDGTSTQHATRLSALISLLEITKFIMQLEET